MMKKDHIIYRHILSIFALSILSILAIGSSDSSSSSSSSSGVELNANVRFNGTQFIITNNDSFDWTNVKLEVNSQTFSGGYVLRSGRMVPGEVYSVGAMQFAKPDGERLNPYSHKVVNIFIMCDTPSGSGYFGGSWE